MDKTQGWILILIAAGAFGWFLQKDIASMPTASDRAMQGHADILSRARAEGLIK